MARAFCTATSGEISIAASAAKTLLQLLAGANRGVAILRVKVSFEGVTAADTPVRVQLLRQTTAGTMSAATETCIAGPGASITPQAVVQYNATGEPTGTVVLDEAYVHPQGGYEWVCQRGQDEILVEGATNRLGVKVIQESGVTTINAIATIWWEE